MKHMKVAALHRPARKPRLKDEVPATETVDLSLRLLERLASSSEPIGVSELAREFASSKATVYRHLQTLVRHGFAHQDSTTMRYAAGIKLFILGERLRERFDILALARGEMLRLGGSIQYIPAQPPQDQIRAVTQAAERISRKLGWHAI
jgi:DNA-binding transcriptional ArsR family regulator